MLRRLACAILSIACLVACSACSPGKSETEEPVTSGFECDLDVQYQDMNVKGHLTRHTAGTLLLELTEPSTLNGLSMEWDGENIALKLHGLSFDVNPSALPESGLGKGILSALDAAIGQRENRAEVSEGIATSGSIAQGEFTLVSDPETGNLLSLEIPSMELSATFSNFAVNSTSSEN